MRPRHLLLAVIVAVAGCHTTEVDMNCEPIEGSNRVVIHANGYAADREIGVSSRIASLEGFANARRKCSRPTTYTMPAPQTSVAFYRDSMYLGSIGAGSNFLFVGCRSGGGLRPASTDELSAFAGLIGASR